MKNPSIQLEIEDLAYTGKGVAKIDGFVYFVPRGVPGDVVEARVVNRKRSYAVATIESFLRRSPFRVEPRCNHVGLCGGCRWQDLDYEIQLKFKEKQVRDSLIHIGNVEGVEVRSIIGAEETFFYRNKMEFSFAAQGDGAALGLHVQGRYDRVFHLDSCYLQSELSNEIVHLFQEFLQRQEISAYDLKERTGLLRFLVIREGKNTGQTMINLITREGKIPHLEVLVGEMQNRFPQVCSFVQTVNSTWSNVATGEYERLILGHERIRERLGEYEFGISATSFFQTNTIQAQRLYDKVAEFATLGGDETLVDLYSGTGTISIYLSGGVQQVIGVESVEQSVMDARRNAELNGVVNCQFIHGKVEDTLPTLDVHNPVAILDPPRAGVHRRGLRALLELAPLRIVYVSCNPTTMARDLVGIIDGGYELKAVQPVDMFPHTYHVESVALLERR